MFVGGSESSYGSSHNRRLLVYCSNTFSHLVLELSKPRTQWQHEGSIKRLTSVQHVKKNLDHRIIRRPARVLLQCTVYASYPI